MKKVLLALACLSIILISYYAIPSTSAQAFHSKEELKHFKVNGLPLDSTYNGYFYGSGKCVGCHAYDPDSIASVDAQGNDINVIDDWRSSMMANSAKDPFWRAKVSHEILVNPTHQVELEDKCTSCHAPLGHYAAKYKGATHYSMSDMLADSVGLDGVSCAACHEQSPQDIGNLFSGEILFDTTDKIYGPYEKNVFGAPMLTYVEEAAFGAHINDAGLCASCHTLITETVDLTGNFTGGEFVEQATYHEWLNSDYGRDDVTCQSCHMPQIDDPVVIADGYANLVDFPKSPYGLHTLVGGNTFMLELLKDNIVELELTASTEEFDETIMKTYELLTQQTLDIAIEKLTVVEDSLYIDLLLTNKAGHKFPSGYPSRRAFIEFVMLNASNDTIFKSGILRGDYEVEGQDPEKEDHYDLIDDETQVQIYELVMQDVNGDVTTTLERADLPMKDNRLTPKGFLTSDPTYDTVQLAGQVLFDNNFNYNALGEEGSGTDNITYAIDLAGYDGEVSISAKVFYQSLPPKWMDEMFSYNSPEIDSFRNMYFDRDNTPVLIASVMKDTITDYGVSIREIENAIALKTFPNPSEDKVWIEVESDAILKKIEIINAIGERLKVIQHYNKTEGIQLPEAQGVYFLRIEISNGDAQVVSVIKQ